MNLPLSDGLRGDVAGKRRTDRHIETSRGHPFTRFMRAPRAEEDACFCAIGARFAIS
jgi:hypothetical protein